MPAGVRARCRTAAYNSDQLSLVRITDNDDTTLRSGSEYPGSLAGPAGRLCRRETAPASAPDGRNLPAGAGRPALISNQAWSALVCVGSGSAGSGAVPGGLCLSSGNPSYRNQGCTGYCRTATEGFARQFPGNDRATQCLGSRVSPDI